MKAIPRNHLIALALFGLARWSSKYAAEAFSPLFPRQTFASNPMSSSSHAGPISSSSLRPIVASSLAMISREELMEKLPSPTVIQAVESKKGAPVVASDLAATAGISFSQARRDLTALASLSQGDIAVSKDGELVYKFPANLSGALAQNSAKYKALQTFQKVWPTLFWLVRVSFGVTLLVSLVAIFSTIFFISTSSSSSSSDDDRRNNRRGGGGMMSFNYFWGPSPFDFFYYRPYGYYGYYGQPERVRDPEEMGFFESVFSYIFGDGNPNPQLDERRLSLVASMIRQNQGAVTVEQLAPFCDDAPDPSQAQTSGYVDESYVLPIVTALNGEPRVTDDGEIVYIFPDLQTSAATTAPSNSLPGAAATNESMVLKRAGLSSRATAGDIKRILEYNGISTRGVLERSELIAILDDSLAPPSPEEEDELALADPSMLREREWKFSLASDLNKVLAGGLGVVNLGGALYLGNLLNQFAAYGVKLPAYYGTVQAFYPLLFGYAVLFNLIPFVRNFWIKRENEKIRQRNQIRSNWKAVLASSIRNSPVKKKLEAARRMGSKLKQIGASADDIVYDTSSSMEENKERKSKADLDSFDQLLGDADSFQ